MTNNSSDFGNIRGQISNCIQTLREAMHQFPTAESMNTLEDRRDILHNYVEAINKILTDCETSLANRWVKTKSQ
jgi:hypothetical protein